GRVHKPSWISEKDEALIHRVFIDLKTWLRITGRPMFAHLERHDRALPQYNVGHLQKILRIEERLLRYPGLALAGNWTYGVGIPDCIEAGERAADALIDRIERQAP